jgi:hypothetical protein
MLPLNDVRMSDGDGFVAIRSQVRALQARLVGTPDLDPDDLGTLRAHLMLCRHEIESCEEWVKRFQEDELADRWRALRRREQDLELREAR